MHPTPHRPRCCWDGSRTGTFTRRPLRQGPEPGTALTRSGQTGRCRDCGNTFDWYHRAGHRPVRLHPRELPAAFVPASHRWHIAPGLAGFSSRGPAWCRVLHAALCPGRAPDPAMASLDVLRRYLASHTRDLIDTGRFTPRISRSACQPCPPHGGMCYRAVRPVDDIRGLAGANCTRKDRPRPGHP